MNPVYRNNCRGRRPSWNVIRWTRLGRGCQKNLTTLASRIVTCTIVALAPAAASAVTFTDVTATAGINHTQTVPSLIQGLPGEAFFSGGVVAGDFDGDGRVDLVFTRLNDNDILYRNRGDGTFEARTSTAGFRFPTYTNGVVSGDVDNDGDLDLYMTTVGYTRNYLYLNDGAGYFTDAGTSHPAALASTVKRSGQGASFGDYDGDGYLDLVTGDWGNSVAASQSRLLRNLGAAQPGGFQDVTVASGINVYRGDRTYRFAPRFVDLDRDGHPDLTFAADFNTSQLFWSNGDGTFTDGTVAAGVGTDLNGMGSTFGDYDSDGDLDWFITNITNDPQHPGPFGGFNRLYRNDGDRQFTDVTLAAGVRDSRWSWGTTFFDYDNDGDSDLAATNGYNGAGWTNDRTYLWENTDGVFQDVSVASGVTDTMQGRGLVHLDYDEDGDLDLLVVNHAAAPILYRNDGGNANHYLRIETQGVVSNRDGIGAWITVTPDLSDPGQQMVWEIDGGSSFVSQNERTAHFGLGSSADPIDLVTIEWPSGIVQRLYGVEVDQTLRVIESLTATPGDYNGDGVIDAADYTLWRDHEGGPAGSLPNDAVGGTIGSAQYVQWAQNYGSVEDSSSSAGGRGVPEPESWVLLTLAASTRLRRRTRSDDPVWFLRRL